MAYLGEDIKKLGFGLMRLPMIDKEVDLEQTKQMVDLFLEKGFTYFDTAYGYIGGKSEESVKEVLVKRHPRESFQLATKLPAWDAKNAEEAKQMLFTSLERTGAEYFDFYLLHNLGIGRTETFDQFELWDFVQEQKKAGRIKHVGFSIHAKADCLEKVLQDHPEMEFVQLQINYADWESDIIQARKCYEVARKYNKPIIIMEPVKGGALANLPEQASHLFTDANPDLSQSSWAIRYAASLEGVITVLSGMSNVEQMQDNLSYMESFQPLDEKEQQVVQQVQKALEEIPQVPCTDCQYCLKDCPQNIPISGTFRAMNEYLVYQDLKRAQGTYGWEISDAGKASDCIACGLCETVCPQSIAIIEELKKSAAVLENKA